MNFKEGSLLSHYGRAIGRCLHLGIRQLAQFRSRRIISAVEKLIAQGRSSEAEVVIARLIADKRCGPDLLILHALCAGNGNAPSTALERWRVAAAACPTNPICPCGIAGSLRALGSLDQARTVVDAAILRFPLDAALASEAARIATTQRDYEEALRCWDRALSIGPIHPDWLFGRGDALLSMRKIDDTKACLQMLQMKAPGHAGVTILREKLELRQSVIFEEDAISLPRIEPLDEENSIAPSKIVSYFESLGDNCEFGLVQRYCFLEPLGLFRFSFSRMPSLIAFLESGMANYGQGDDLRILLNEGNQAFDCKSIYYDDFTYHTEVYAYQTDAETLRRREKIKVNYLIRRFTEDIEDGRKVFVRKGGSFEEAKRLHQLLRKQGKANLLWVETSDAHHPPGHVEEVEPGFFSGRIARFAPYANAHDIDLPTWMSLLCNTHNLIYGREYRIQQNMVHRAGWKWRFSSLCQTETLGPFANSNAPVQRLRLTGDTTRCAAVVADRLIEYSNTSDSVVTFSLWVWIGDQFRGSFIDVCFNDSTSKFVSYIDLSKRNEWQRVWASSLLERATMCSHTSLRITGFKDDVVYIGCWLLESGCIPNPWVLPVTGQIDPVHD